jgi:hypothetical protein
MWILVTTAVHAIETSPQLFGHDLDMGFKPPGIVLAWN